MRRHLASGSGCSGRDSRRAGAALRRIILFALLTEESIATSGSMAAGRPGAPGRYFSILPGHYGGGPDEIHRQAPPPDKDIERSCRR